MIYLAATLHTVGVQLGDTMEAKIKGDPQRGSVTIEQVIWAVAFIAIAGIVVAAITRYVTTKSASIK